MPILENLKDLIDKTRSSLSQSLAEKAKNTAVDMVKKKTANTLNACQVILESFKRYILFFKYFFIVISLATSAYDIFTYSSKRYVSMIMMGVVIIYAILDAIFRKYKKVKPSKRLNRVYAWIKIVLNFMAISSTFYSLFIASQDDKINSISLLLIVFSVILFVLKVLLEVVSEILASKWDILKVALIEDGILKNPDEEPLDQIPMIDQTTVEKPKKKRAKSKK